jgi:hypothetical protein
MSRVRHHAQDRSAAPRENNKPVTIALNKYPDYYFFDLPPPTPRASLLKFPKLDLCLCCGVGARVARTSALTGGRDALGTSGNTFSRVVSVVLADADVRSSYWNCGPFVLFDLSCTLLNLSSNSAHRITPSSRPLSRLGLSNDAGVVGGALRQVSPLCASKFSGENLHSCWYVQISYGTNTIETILQRRERRRLGE